MFENGKKKKKKQSKYAVYLQKKRNAQQASEKKVDLPWYQARAKLVQYNS